MSELTREVERRRRRQRRPRSREVKNVSHFHEIKSDGTLGVRVDGRNPPHRLSDGRRINGVVNLDNCYNCPTTDEDNRFAELWPEARGTIPQQPHQYMVSRDTYAKDEPNQKVDASVTWEYVSAEQAARDVRSRIDSRWQDAINLGIPHTVALNGDSVSALLRYNEVDRLVWGSHDYGMAGPTGGLLVALVQPLNAPGKPYDGKDQFAIAGKARLDAAKLTIRDHINQASLAWETGQDEVTSIVNNGAMSDEEKVNALAAVDVNSYNWPPNTVASP